MRSEELTGAGDGDNAKKGARISRCRTPMGRGARSYTVRKQHKSDVNKEARSYRYNTRSPGDEMSDTAGPGVRGRSPGRFFGSMRALFVGSKKHPHVKGSARCADPSPSTIQHFAFNLQHYRPQAATPHLPSYNTAPGRKIPRRSRRYIQGQALPPGGTGTTRRRHTKA